MREYKDLYMPDKKGNIYIDTEWGKRQIFCGCGKYDIAITAIYFDDKVVRFIPLFSVLEYCQTCGHHFYVFTNNRNQLYNLLKHTKPEFRRTITETLRKVK